MIKRMLKSGSFQLAVVVFVLVGSIAGSAYGLNRRFNNQVSDAKARAQVLVGEQNIVGLDWSEVGHVEVSFASGESISVPIDTGDGAQFADYCFKANHASKPLATKFRVRVFYFDQTAIPNGISSDDAVRMPGAYLMFAEIDPKPERTDNQ